jgi:hypothetical protein
MVIKHSEKSVPAVGNAGLSVQDLEDGYCATLCFVTTNGEFVDVHVTPRHLEHLARLLEDTKRFTDAERFRDAQRRIT